MPCISLYSFGINSGWSNIICEVMDVTVTICRLSVGCVYFHGKQLLFNDISDISSVCSVASRTHLNSTEEDRNVALEEGNGVVCWIMGALVLLNNLAAVATAIDGGGIELKGGGVVAVLVSPVYIVGFVVVLVLCIFQIRKRLIHVNFWIHDKYCHVIES